MHRNHHHVYQCSMCQMLAIKTPTENPATNALFFVNKILSLYEETKEGNIFGAIVVCLRPLQLGPFFILLYHLQIYCLNKYQRFKKFGERQYLKSVVDYIKRNLGDQIH